MSLRDEDVLRLLLDVALELSSIQRLDALLHRAVERATEVLDAERALLALFDPEGDVEQQIVHNLPEAPQAKLPISHSLLRRVVETRETVVVSDVDRDVAFSSRGSVRTHGIRFMTGVPVAPMRGPFGVLYVDSTARVVQDISGRVEVLEIIAALLGSALDNAYLIDTLKTREEEIRQVVHGMRAPLSGIILSAGFLGQGGEIPVDTRKEIARDVRGASEQLSRMVDQTLELSRLDSGASDEPEVVSAAAEAERHLASLRPIAESFGTRVLLDVQGDLPDVQAVRSRLGVVLDNLVFNAIKHAEPGSDVVIELRERTDAGPPDALRRRPSTRRLLLQRKDRWKPAAGCRFVELSVHNRGPIIPPEVLPTLFSDRRRSDEPRDVVASSGLGLPIADECVRRWGGALWARSDAESGTRFSFTVPTHLMLAS